MQDIISTNYASGKQTFIIPLTFGDVKDARDVITRIGYGGDVWELRVDLLSPNPGPLGEENLPPLDYVESQIRELQALSPLPILYTIRTRGQGGKFPDGAVEEALQLMLLAIEKGIKYIDVEIEWPQSLIQEVTAKKGDTQVVASYHNWSGKVAWTSEELKKHFEIANEFGDIIKLSIMSAQIEDCYELGLFIRDYQSRYTKPLLTIGMGANGQLSRITSPISLVTHPLMPFPSAPGQLSLAQVHRAQHLIGLLPAKKFFVVKDQASVEKIVACFQSAFDEMGYPYTCEASDALHASSIIPDGIEGIAALFHQWTGRRAPVSIMESSYHE
ncbi:hypothetical protein PFICI_04737 [Pestalotiopsis fici W106-1]|uniref:3-dehydroquinate dehydratase n=1 Tax=Pestalotiopsis fici (strain W106-1 / CGMCC3.15140) TaxID=1229662 RepID=W3XCF7_PESFW|nr:uncharacterized protein PFICI_04737 [Pestalotiopsis fici W106-1]ETS82861.1 hypothetical protein PFICI_04737 [Pestalotiopsis fici W106-1]